MHDMTSGQTKIRPRWRMCCVSGGNTRKNSTVWTMAKNADTAIATPSAACIRAPQTTITKNTMALIPLYSSSRRNSPDALSCARATEAIASAGSPTDSTWNSNTDVSHFWPNSRWNTAGAIAIWMMQIGVET